MRASYNSPSSSIQILITLSSDLIRSDPSLPKMLRVEVSVRNLSGLGIPSSSDQSKFMPHSSSSSNPNTLTASAAAASSSSGFNQSLTLRIRRPHHPHHQHHHHHHSRLKNPFISCSNSYSHHHHDDFLEASLLLSETLRHYHLRKQGFHEEAKRSSRPFTSFSAQTNDFKAGINTLGLGILRRFQNPTVFLKISCEGDFLLPIVVGEFAIEKLIDSLDEDDHGDHLNHFLFVRTITIDLGYEVKMVKITRRVVNTYFARIYVGKVGEKASFSVDARPSDAINVARICKAPIYVNKQIVLTDAIKIAYGTGRIRDTKPVYDVLLDSPMEGPDLFGEELKLVHQMKVAVEDERYEDAAMWRDQLVKLRNSGP